MRIRSLRKIQALKDNHVKETMKVERIFYPYYMMLWTAKTFLYLVKQFLMLVLVLYYKSRIFLKCCYCYLFLPIVINKGSIIACLIKHVKYPQNGDIKYKIRNWLDIVCDIIFIWFSLIPISISPLPRDHAWMYYRFMLQYIPLFYATKVTRHIFGYIASVTFLFSIYVIKENFLCVC